MSERRKYEVIIPGPDGSMVAETIEAGHIWIGHGGTLSFGQDGPGETRYTRIFAPGTWSHVRVVE